MLIPSSNAAERARSMQPSRLRSAFLRAPGALALAALFALAACGQEGITTRRGTTGGAGGEGGGASTSTSTSSSSGSGGSGGSGPAAQAVSIANWNTHNFFNNKNDDANMSEIFLSAAEYAQKRVDVATVLIELNADIAVLQEIENQSVLDDLNASIMLEGGQSYPYTSLTPTFDTREIAILSRLPIDKAVSHQDEFFEQWGTMGPSYKFTRDCIEVHLTVNGRELILLGVHFRSKVAPDDPDKRLAEAQHTRDIANAVLKASPDAALIILGDYNDTPGSPPVSAVLGSGAGAFSDMAMLVPKTSQWSFNFMGSQELIDHQIVNPLLAGMVDAASVVITHTASVNIASDHAPVKATYSIK